MSIDERIAGAPISWGVCEVPGWGHQIAPERVFSEMREVGLPEVLAARLEHGI